ncbi:MAG: hypothetical protein ACF8R7_11790 [Phycisphaerales bacterium JB039]
MRLLAVMALAAIVIGATSGCATRPGPAQPEAIDRGPAPAYAEVASRYNARVADTERIWARATTRIWYTDDKGEDQSDQADGHLAYIAPRQVLLTIERFGETYAILGSDAERYWWISLAEADRGAIVGAHEQTTPEAALRAGLPVHPLDLLALIGVAPLPAEGAVTWSDDGRRLIVVTSGRWGPIRLELDPGSAEPAAVALLRDGQIAISSALTEFTPYARRDQPSDVRLPGEVMVTVHDTGTRIRMNLSDYRAWGRRPNAAMFDLESQLRGNRIAPEQIRRVEDVLAGAAQP